MQSRNLIIPTARLILLSWWGTAPGQEKPAGLWTKADSVTAFDDLTVSQP